MTMPAPDSNADDKGGNFLDKASNTFDSIKDFGGNIKDLGGNSIDSIKDFGSKLGLWA